MIKSQGLNKLRWDLSIIILAIYQAITIPISITYDPDDFSSPINKTIDSMIDLVFLIDIIINFRTSYVDPINGEEVLDTWTVAVYYVMSL